MDEEYLLRTPENVPISYELAGLGSRFLAALLDSLMMGAIGAAFVLIALAAGAFSAITSSPDAVIWSFAILLSTSAALLFGYPLFFEIAWSGQTPGKRKVGIRIIQDGGSPISPMSAVVRNVMRLIDYLPSYYIIGAAVMLIDRKGRRLGDIAAGTICVKERRDLEPGRISSRASAHGRRKTPPQSAPLDDVRRLTHEDQHLLKEYLLRREKMAPKAAENLAARIAPRIASVLGTEMANESADEFLERIGLHLDQEERQG